MRRLGIFFILGWAWGLAAPVSLEQLLEHAKAPQLIEQRLQEERLGHQARASASSQTDPLTLNHAISRNNGRGVSGYEQEVTLSKSFLLGEIQSATEQQQMLASEAYLLEERQTLISLINQLKNRYHQYCLDQEYLATMQEAYDTLAMLYEKKQRAFEEGEIAKTELLQIELEVRRLQITVARLVRQAENAHDFLLSLSTLPKETALSCNQMYPIEAQFTITNAAQALSQRAYEKRLQSLQKGLTRYGHAIDRVEVSVGYTKELESDIYTLGLSIPLNFTSERSAYERAALMHQSSAITLQYEAQTQQKARQIASAAQALHNHYETIRAEEENIEHYRTRLLTMIKKSYDYGESSVIEYLLSQQQLYTLEQELLKEKKAYYQTLFRLYTLSETKEK